MGALEQGTARRSGMHLVGLFALAVAQPLFDVLGRSPEFFVAHGSEPVDIVLLTVLVCIGLPLVLVALEWLVGLVSETAARWLHLALVWLLCAILAFFVLQRFIGDNAALPIAALLGGLAAFAYVRSAKLRGLLGMLAGAPLVVAAIFLLRPSMRPVLAGGQPGDPVDVAIANPAPVVFIVFDEFSGLSLMDRQENLDAARYPNFARLARDSYWFRNATTVNYRSEIAVPALLSGLYPRKSVVQTYQEHPNNLFTLLGETYQVTAFETLTRLCPPQVCKRSEPEPAAERLGAMIEDAAVVEGHILLPDAVADATLPSIDTRWADFVEPSDEEAPTWPPPARKREAPKGPELPNIHQVLAMDRARLFSQFVDSIRADGQPALNFLHITVPHTDWRFLPSGRDYGLRGFQAMEGVIRKTGVWVTDEWAVTQGAQRYLLQVGYADYLVGKLIAHLEEIGLWDRALVVITADHGVSTMPGEPRRSLGERGYPELLSVPLFVRLPGQKVGVVSDRNVETIDVLPTVAHALGIALPWTLDGQSALDDTQPERREKRFANDFKNGEVQWRVFGRDIPERRQNIERLADLFGTGADTPDRRYAIGPYRDLVGQPVPQDLPADPTVWLGIDSANLRQVDLDSLVPARLTGLVVSPDASAPIHIAIALNGTIAAVTRAAAGNSRRPYTTMVPDSALRQGANQIEALVIREEKGQLRLYRSAPDRP